MYSYLLSLYKLCYSIVHRSMLHISFLSFAYSCSSLVWLGMVIDTFKQHFELKNKILFTYRACYHILLSFRFWILGFVTHGRLSAWLVKHEPVQCSPLGSGSLQTEFGVHSDFIRYADDTIYENIAWVVNWRLYFM